MNSEQTMPNEWRKSAFYAALSSLIMVFILLIVYVIYYSKPDFSSDDAVLSLQAESIFEQASLFPKGWTSNNGDLMVPSGVLILAPLLAWFPNSFGLHSIAGVFATLLMLGSFLWFLSSTKLPSFLVLIATAIVASGMSWISAIFIYLQTTYVWWPVGFFLGATIVLHHRSLQPRVARNTKIAVALMFSGVFLLSFANPGRAILMVVIPLYFFDRVLARRQSSFLAESSPGVFHSLGLRDPLVTVAFGGAVALASIMHYALLYFGIAETIHNASNLRWDGLAAVLQHTRIFLQGWPEYLGGARELNSTVGGVVDPLRYVRFAFSIWLSWVGVIEVIRLRLNEDPVRSALTAAFLAAFLPILLMYLTLSPLAVNFTTTRYFTVPMIILVALGAFRVADAQRRWPQRVAAITITVAVLLVVGSAVRFIPFFSGASASLMETRESHAMRLSSILNREELTWGYATWWNAGAVTILSAGKSRVSPITIDDGKISAYPTMTQAGWYSPTSWNGETFLALSRSEATPKELVRILERLGPPSSIVETPEFLIQKYDHNISRDFPCASGVPMMSKLEESVPIGHIASADLIEKDTGRARILVRNSGPVTLDGRGAYPVAIGMHLLSDSGSILNRDWLHVLLPCPIGPGEERVVVVDLPKAPPGARSAEVDLVQEGVAWFEQWNAKTAILDLSKGKRH